jgi:hypothetical protein
MEDVQLQSKEAVPHIRGKGYWLQVIGEDDATQCRHHIHSGALGSRKLLPLPIEDQGITCPGTHP